MPNIRDNNNPYAAPESLDGICLKEGAMPASVKAGLFALAFLALEQSVLLMLALVLALFASLPGDILGYVAFAGLIFAVCIALFVGLFRGKQAAWINCQAMCRFGALFLAWMCYGDVATLLSDPLALSPIALLTMCIVLAQFGLLAMIYFPLQRKTARAYCGFRPSDSIADHDQPKVPTMPEQV